MVNTQHLKTLNWKSIDNSNNKKSDGSSNRIRFTSAKERSKHITADVYRSYKRRGGADSATREERVHTSDIRVKPNKRRRKTNVGEQGYIVQNEKPELFNEEKEDENIDQSLFASELELAQDRNASEAYSNLYKEIWPISRSLPEILHHLKSIITCLMKHLLTAKTCTIEVKSPSSSISSATITGYVINHATNDILHLIGVLARDLRHEIHPFMYTQILPRVIKDMLNPPTSEIWMKENNLQGYVVDVQIVEMAFRTLSYCFRYDADQLLNINYSKNKKCAKVKNQQHSNSNRDNVVGVDSSHSSCLEEMRQFYGATLAHKRECVRRLAAECFAPLVQKLKTKEKTKHLKRVIRALATACCNNGNHSSSERKEKSNRSVSFQVQRARNDALDGISMLLFCISKGIPGRLHSKAQSILTTVLECIGAPGKNTNHTSTSSENHLCERQNIIAALASKFIFRLCDYVDPQNFSLVWDVIINSSQISTQNTSKLISNDSSTNQTSDSFPTDYTLASNALAHTAQILKNCVAYKNGILCKDARQSERLSSTISLIFESKCYWNIPIFYSNRYFLQKSILQLLCTSWKLYPHDPIFASKFPAHFQPIINARYDENDKNSNNAQNESNELYMMEGKLDPALLLGKELLPYLPPQVVMKTLAPTLLEAAVRQLIDEKKTDNALILLQAVTSVQPVNLSTRAYVKKPDFNLNTTNNYDEFCNLFFINYANDCTIPQAHRDTLLDLCLSYNQDEKSNSKDIKFDFPRLGFAIRCIPFLVFVKCVKTGLSSTTSSTVEKKVLKWFGSTLKKLEKYTSENEIEDKISSKLVIESSIVSKALLLEALSIVCKEILSRDKSLETKEKNPIQSILKKNQKSAYKFLIQNPTSVWVLKSVSVFVQILQQASISHIGELSSYPDEIFDTLNSNLRSESHVIRFYTLKILDTLPQKPFILDHADLDLSEDLDEEPSTFQNSSDGGVKQTDRNKSSGLFSSNFTGACDLISTLYSIESLSMTLENERSLTSKLNRVEVLSASGKLPIVYAEAAANLMFGILHKKFSPLWPPAIRVLVELSNILLAGSKNSVVWQPLLAKLEEVTNESLTAIDNSNNMLSDKNSLDSENENYISLAVVIEQHDLSCRIWHASKGLKNLISQKFNVQKGADVLRLSSTDNATYFELVWSVMEKVPHLTIKKSRIIVSLFLEFLHYQYYGEECQEPDARELCLMDHIKLDAKMRTWSSSNSGKKMKNRKLASFLKMFSAVNGPQQLYKHRYLEKIYLAHLSNSDVAIAGLALLCIKKYKHTFFLPYFDNLNQMLIKGELRETLTKFNVSQNEGTVDSHHRISLIPVLSRILFGRLTARGMGSKSSKDTPVARRGAILSFFSGLEQTSNELNWFIYFMVRIFIPSNISMKISDEELKGEFESTKKLDYLIRSVEMVNVEDMSKLSMNKIIGFLNLLIDSISKIGFGLFKFIPIFYSILLTICEFTEVKTGTQHTIEIDDDSGSDERKDQSVGNVDSNFRLSSVRRLCFRCLSKLFAQFSSSFDFRTNCGKLWLHLNSALLKLPISSLNEERPSSLLLLLETISSDPNLIPLLKDCENAVASIIKCISSNTKDTILEICLNFIENLLTEGGTMNGSISGVIDGENSVGVQVIESHMDLLIYQFTKRIGSQGSDTVIEDSFDKVVQSKESALQTSRVARRELTILCRISNILINDKQVPNSKPETNWEKVKTLETLCGLLLPFIKLERGANEIIQLSVLGVLKSFIPQLSGTVALSYITSLSKLLGPNKSKAGISSLKIRQLIISVFDTISDCDEATICHKRVSKLLQKLNAMDSRYVLEYDYEQIIPALNQLGNDLHKDGSWYHLSRTSTINDATNQEDIDIKGGAVKKPKCFNYKPSELGYGTQPKALTPLLYQCLHALYDSDGVINRGAFKALRSFIHIAGKCVKNCDTAIKDSIEDNNYDPWLNLIQRTLIPNISICLTSNIDSVRRYLILLISDVSKCFAHFKSSNLYNDLTILIRDDDLEQDFFQNITHVQSHRRNKAFSTLRKYLSMRKENSDDKEFLYEFSQHSLSNVLIRIALHPIFECNKPSDESYVLDAIATVGSISRRLVWSKYYGLLNTLLIQIKRKQNQVRYIIGAICAVTDAFHFEIDTGDSSSQSETQGTSTGNTVWKALQNKIIPQLEGNLVKEVVKNDGSRLKVLRPPVALALTKLLLKLPVGVFELKLPRLLIMISTTLKSRDSTVRDTSRETLSRIAVILDTKYLSDIIHQLAVSLADGYQLHVRAKTLHTIIRKIADTRKNENDITKHEPMSPYFDHCIPAIMDLIQQDLFGTASEMKEAQDIQKRVIKEAVGVASYDTLEIVCKLVNFRQSTNKNKNVDEIFSAIHVITRPLLERLQMPDIDTVTIGKLRECLNRVVIGISHNQSAEVHNLMPFIHGCVAPFIVKEDKYTQDYCSSDESDVENEIKKISISGGRNDRDTKVESKTFGASIVAQWTPSSLNTASDKKSAQFYKKKQKQELHRVQDGANAPKLTGKGRYGPTTSVSSRSFTDPAKSSGVIFGLSLLNSCLKRMKFNSKSNEILSMADPFIWILTECVKECSNNEIILLALKCLGFLLRWDLPSVHKSTEKLGSYTLNLLISSGSSSNTRHEITQGCFKIITFLITYSKTSRNDSNVQPSNLNNVVLKADETYKQPLNGEQMESLISLLHSTVADSEHQNATFGLIKAIATTRYLSSEFYDLMEKILKLSVQSQKDTVRQQASIIFVDFLLKYPLGEKRFEDHLKQIVLNLKYEYEDGRISAIKLLSIVIEKIPSKVLEDHAQFFFLPLVLQLVNDDSEKCRVAVAKVISSIFQLASIEIIQTLYDYIVRWFNDNEVEISGIQRASAQLLGLVVESRPDFIKRGNNVKHLISMLYEVLQKDFDTSFSENKWELGYFCLLCFEKINLILPKGTKDYIDIWQAIIKWLSHPHLWIKQAAARILNEHMSSISSESFPKDESSFISWIPGSLYDIAKNICQQIDSLDDKLTPSFSTLVIKILTWVVNAMHFNPALCYREEPVIPEKNLDNSGDKKSKSKDPVAWVMNRLSNIAKNKGKIRRSIIFKCFASFASSCEKQVVAPYLETILVPLHRAYAEEENALNQRKDTDDDPDTSNLDLIKDVMQVLEDRCGTEIFIKEYTVVKARAKERRIKRKQDLASEVVNDPVTAAKRKIRKQERERERKKRRMNEKKLGLYRKH